MSSLGAAVKSGDGQAIRFELGPIEVEVEVAVTKKTTGNAGWSGRVSCVPTGSRVLYSPVGG
jgi:hypothetical protein